MMLYVPWFSFVSRWGYPKDLTLTTASTKICTIAALAQSMWQVLIVNLPGHPNAVRQCLTVLLPVLPHLLRMLGWCSGKSNIWSAFGQQKKAENFPRKCRLVGSVVKKNGMISDIFWWLSENQNLPLCPCWMWTPLGLQFIVFDIVTGHSLQDSQGGSHQKGSHQIAMNEPSQRDDWAWWGLGEEQGPCDVLVSPICIHWPFAPCWNSKLSNCAWEHPKECWKLLRSIFSLFRHLFPCIGSSWHLRYIVHNRQLRYNYQL